MKSFFGFKVLLQPWRKLSILLGEICDLRRSLTNFKSKLLLLLSAKFNLTPTTGLLHHCWSPHYLLNG